MTRSVYRRDNRDVGDKATVQDGHVLAGQFLVISFSYRRKITYSVRSADGSVATDRLKLTVCGQSLPKRRAMAVGKSSSYGSGPTQDGFQVHGIGSCSPMIWARDDRN